MKLTKDRFTNWEDIDEDYDILLDDELIISIKPEERSKDMADYILECQEKAELLDKIKNKIKSFNEEHDVYFCSVEWVEDILGDES
jgi:hypothetical protein